jgi:glycosyltransferase involved in cell wall biosynthesis
MKIIALIPVKNEAWILKSTIPRLKKFADEILCTDGGSTDGTLEYLKSAGVNVRPQAQKQTNFSAWRSELLAWGRERGGTHFIWLDADEAFTANFLGEKNGIPFRERLSKMKPGEKLALQWLCLWKSPHTYRDDASVWSNLYKDFIVCDDPATSFENKIIHEGRTPGPNTNPDGTVSWTKISPDEGAVLHFQFVPFEKYQLKQAYQRCIERNMNAVSPQRINNKYTATLDDPDVRTRPVPKEWISGIAGLGTISFARDSWFLDAILDFFKEKGILYYEPLQIWHIPELKAAFKKETGRDPVPKTYPAFVIRTKKIVDRIKNKTRGMLK